jgi:hypothetical protein
VNFFFENLRLVPETSAAMEHFKLVFGSGTSDPAKIRPLKNWTSWISWKSSLFVNFHPSVLQVSAFHWLNFPKSRNKSSEVRSKKWLFT